MRSKKGLSTVVTTLIIVLLVLVAIGIIWAVIRGIIEGGTGQIDVRSKCIEVDVRATAASCIDTGTPPTSADCTITLRRGTGGDDIGGVKLVFKNAAGTSTSVIDVSGNITPLVSVTKDKNSVAGLGNVGVTGLNKVEATAYFLDPNTNEQQLCGTSSEFNF